MDNQTFKSIDFVKSWEHKPYDPNKQNYFTPEQLLLRLTTEEGEKQLYVSEQRSVEMEWPDREHKIHWAWGLDNEGVLEPTTIQDYDLLFREAKDKWDKSQGYSMCEVRFFKQDKVRWAFGKLSDEEYICERLKTIFGVGFINCRKTRFVLKRTRELKFDDIRLAVVHPLLEKVGAFKLKHDIKELNSFEIKVQRSSKQNEITKLGKRSLADMFNDYVFK